LVGRVLALGVSIGPAMRQVDCYFNHPERDFAKTDEALRIRTVDENSVITYKGPKIDSTMKIRPEIELPLAAGAQSAADFADLLDRLGFRRVAEVCKSRRQACLRRKNHDIVVALDEVEQVGSFCELEIIVAEDDVEASKGAILSLAEELNLDAPVRRSYLSLYLKAIEARR
jgi:adenylate cyclase class 2